MSFTFGDVEPEDSWDRGDAVHELVDNLVRRLVLVAEAVANGIADARARHRLEQVIDDLRFVRERAEDEL